MEDLGLVDEMLADAYELVLEGWCQGAEAQDEFGQPVEPSSASARRWSASGALTRVWERSEDRSGRRSRRSTRRTWPWSPSSEMLRKRGTTLLTERSGRFSTRSLSRRTR